MKKVIAVVKRVVAALCLLYTFNLITSGAGILIPINVASIGVVTVLGIPSLFALLLLHKFL